MKERGNKTLKLLDKYVGIPLIALFGLLRRKRRFDIASVRHEELRFVLLKTAAIGDTVMLSAVIREIKQAYPRSSVRIVVSRANSAIAQMLPGADEIVVFDMSRPVRSLVMAASRQRAHVLMDFAPWARINSLIAYFMNADCKIGFKTRRAGRHFIYDRAVEHSGDRHELDNYRALLHAMPMPTKGCLPVLNLDQNALNKAGHLLKNDRARVVFHPFPGGYRKQLKEWPLENWIETGRRLIKAGCTIYISGDRNDLPDALRIEQELNRDGRNCTVLCGNFSLAEVAAILYKSRMLVTVNTGIMHIGAALDIPLIALHGPTSPLRWGPVSNNAVIMKPKVDCAPCISLGYEYQCSEGGCMRTISVDDVFRQAERILNMP